MSIQQAVQQPTVSTPDSLLLNVPQAARLLGLTSWQIRGLVWDKHLPVVKVGRKLYFRKTTLIRWAENSEHKHRG
jgi:excisionase family DNA binding protein